MLVCNADSNSLDVTLDVAHIGVTVGEVDGTIASVRRLGGTIRKTWLDWYLQLLMDGGP